MKGPAFTLADIVEAGGRGRSCATDHPGKLMAFGRAASALGVAKALEEVDPAHADESAVLKDFDTYSSVVCTENPLHPDVVMMKTAKDHV